MELSTENLHKMRDAFYQRRLRGSQFDSIGIVDTENGKTRVSVHGSKNEVPTTKSVEIDTPDTTIHPDIDYALDELLGVAKRWKYKV